MLGRRSLLIILAVLTLLVRPAAAFADTRVALLIGNSAYSATAQLPNPGNDVALMKTVLEGAKFDVVETAVNLDRAGMIRTLRNFAAKANTADIAVVYYSGHGMEMGGRNYVLPVDVKLATDNDVEDEAIALDRIERAIQGARRFRLVILDACRNNPFEASMAHSGATRAVVRGLSRVEPSTGDTLIAYAAKAGTVASDGDGPNSPFTIALAKHLVTPGVDVRIAFGLIRDDVLASTGRQQEPFVYGSLGGEPLPLNKVSPPAIPPAPPPAAAAIPPQTPTAGNCADAAAHWAAAQRFDKLEFYQAHVELFGTCVFAPFAKARIAELTKLASAPPQAPEPAPAAKAPEPEPPAEPSEVQPPVPSPSAPVSAEGPYVLPDGAKVVLQLGHADTVTAVSISADQRLLLSGSDDRSIKLWDKATGKLLKTFEGHAEKVKAVAFSPTAPIFASGDDDGTLKVWDLDGNQLRSSDDGPTVGAVAFSTDGRLLASSSGKTIRIREAGSGEVLRSIEDHADYVRSLGFSADGRFLVSGSDDKTVKLWEVSSGRLIRSFEGHEDWVRCVAISPDGRKVVSGSEKTIRLWETDKSGDPKILDGGGNVYALAFSPDGRSIASGASDNKIKLWDAASASLVRVFEGHSHNVYSVVFSKDGLSLVSGSGDESLKLWDVATAKAVRTYEGPASGVGVAAFSPDGRSIVSGGTRNILRLLDPTSGKPIRKFDGAEQYIHAAVFSPDGHLLATGGSSDSVALWDTSSGRLVRQLEGHSDWVKSVAFSRDGRFIASGSDDKTVKIWTVDGKLLRTLEGHTDYVRGVAFLPDGMTLVSGSGKELKLWNVASGKLIRDFQAPDTQVYAIAVSPDGRSVAAGGIYGMLGLWNVANGKQVQNFQANRGTEPDHGTIYTLAFLPDGRQLLSGNASYDLRLWDTASGALVRTFEGHLGNIEAVSLSADGKIALSASDDRTLRVWEVGTGKMIAAFINGQEDWAAISPDGTYVASENAGRFFAIVRGIGLLPSEEFVQRRRRDRLAAQFTVDQ